MTQNDAGTDGGKTFGPLHSNITKMRSTNPAAVVVTEVASSSSSSSSSSGSPTTNAPTVLLFFNRARVPLSDYQAMVMESVDYGVSWSAPRLVVEPSVSGRASSEDDDAFPVIVGPGTGAVVLPTGGKGGVPRVLLSLYE